MHGRGRQHSGSRCAPEIRGPRGVKDPTHARKLHAQELGDPSFDPVASAWGPRHEPTKGTMAMNERGESDRPVVPRKSPNKGGAAASSAEGTEGRGLAKENPLRQNQPIGPRAATGWQNALERIRQAAKERLRV